MRVAFDIVGTFTDVIALGRDKRIHTAKVLSLLDRVGEDIVACIKGLDSGEPVENFVHATTMASNTNARAWWNSFIMKSYSSPAVRSFSSTRLR